MISTPVRARHRRVTALTAVAGAAALFSAGLLAAEPSQAAVSCSVKYTVASQWSGGFVAAVDVTNTGDALSGWQLVWSFGSGQAVTSGWNATVSQSGSTVTAANVGYNGAVASGGTVSFGFHGSSGSSNAVPSSFTLNGVTCTGGGGGGSTSTTTTRAGSTTGATTTTRAATTTTTRTPTTPTVPAAAASPAWSAGPPRTAAPPAAAAPRPPP